MDSKTLAVLEYDKILERLARFCDFSASMEAARGLSPSASYDLALSRLAETTEARRLFAAQNVGVGASRDIRSAAALAARGGVLDPQTLLDVKSTLIACRDLKKTFEKKEGDYPRLCLIAQGLPETRGIVDAVSRVLSERGEVLDSASVKLADIRRNLRVARERLMNRLQRYLSDSKTAPMLQETLITQRDGRYVIPLRAEFKGKIKAVIHDQSASGATLFIEPLPVVEANNEIRELQLAERDEERRILAEVSALIGEHADELKYGVENLAALDLAFAKAKYAEELQASEPELIQTDDKGQKTDDLRLSPVVRLLHARHPLIDPRSVVPIDIDPREGTRAIVITGPNTGGKTVSLKTVGLLALMAQSGLHIPAQSGSQLPFFRSVYADIGDEQSIEQSLSTFSGHIANIIRILKKMDSRSLVIFDELGSGTDPQEGAALARAILNHMLQIGATTFVATHYPELKTFAHATENVVNASLEFDVKTLRPTYKLTLGLPGRSNALAIAQRLGLPQEIIESAKAEIDPLDLRADKLLDDIRKERNRASREREKLEKQRVKLEEQNADLQKRLRQIEDERREALAQARAEGELEVAILKRNIASLKAQMKKASQSLASVQALEEKTEKLEESFADKGQKKKDVPSPSVRDSSSVKLGEKVWVSSLQAEGVVTALGESDAEIQIGTIRMRAKFSDLSKKQTKDERPTTKETPRPSSSVLRSPSAAPKMEADLRGLTAEDALDKLEKYLEQAYLAGMPFVRIIHGKGTGRLRQAVREALRGHAYVASFEEGGHTEGGEGVTVAKLNAS
ncbi:MAG: endonuclease MutS2 [Anaerolineales bacterium]|nr:endonuclease MutS2 [Anaerolineales bacterium]